MEKILIEIMRCGKSGFPQIPWGISGKFSSAPCPGSGHARIPYLNRAVSSTKLSPPYISRLR